MATDGKLRGVHRPSAHQEELAKARKATAKHDAKVEQMRRPKKKKATPKK